MGEKGITASAVADEIISCIGCYIGDSGEKEIAKERIRVILSEYFPEAAQDGAAPSPDTEPPAEGKPAAYGAMDVAKFILLLACKQKVRVDLIYLQHILYRAWVDWFGATGEELFNEGDCSTFIAGPSGPEVPSVQAAFCMTGNSDLAAYYGSTIWAKDRKKLECTVLPLLKRQPEMLKRMNKARKSAWAEAFARNPRESIRLGTLKKNLQEVEGYVG